MLGERELPPGAYERGDLASYGHIGLLEAKERFDPNYGVELGAMPGLEFAALYWMGFAMAWENTEGPITNGSGVIINVGMMAAPRLVMATSEATKPTQHSAKSTIMLRHFAQSPRHACLMLRRLAWGQELAIMRQALEELDTKSDALSERSTI